ncbi:MAG: DUF4358 domain-containing protein [Eubacteriales bacterium]
MKTIKLCLASTLLLSVLIGCSASDTSTTPEVDTTVPTTPNATLDITPEVTPFELPEWYAHLDPEIATVFCSIQNMPEFLYVPNMPLDEQMLADTMGITSDSYSAFYGEVPMMSQQADMFLLFRTEDTEALSTLLEEYLFTQLSNSSQYPATILKLSVGEVGVFEDYVYLNMLSSYPENESELDEAAMVAFYTETIAKVNAEVERVLGGGEPNPPKEPTDDLVTGDMGVTDQDNLGEFQTPSGDPSDFVVDENDTQPAVPPEGDGGVIMPAIGEETGGHDPAGVPNTRG